MTPYYCPNCHAQCRTPESLGIHVGRCRAMSEGEIYNLIVGKCISDESAKFAARAVHFYHIAKLRGRKS